MPLEPMQLAGKLLIAMPGMEDPRFARSVILICAHSEDSAMGLILNKPAKGLSFSHLLEQLDLEAGLGSDQIKVHIGGPVETGRGFVLHSGDWRSDTASMTVPGGYHLTGTIDVLTALSAGLGPMRAFLALGYAGWGALQLEGEIQRNDWLIVDASPELVFDTPDPEKWARGLKALGVDPVTLSAAAGRA